MMPYLRNGFLVVFAVFFSVFAQSRDDVPASNGDLDVTAKNIFELDSEYFTYYDVIIQNKSDRWVTIRSVTVSFPDTFWSTRVSLTSGDKYALWRQTMSDALREEEVDQKSTMAAIGALGAGLAAFSGNSTLNTAGNAMLFGSVVGYGASEISKLSDSIKQVRGFPNNHLLRDSILIPPGLSAKRWLLLNSRDHKSAKSPIREFVLTFRRENDSTYSYPISVVYPKNTRPKWQRSLRPW